MPSDPIDVHVGLRIRQRRALLGMTQTALGQAVGLTFQQIQKYEKGKNRASASRLYEFAVILDVPVEHFFEGLSNSDFAKATRSTGRLPRIDPQIVSTKRETLELVRAYYKIRDSRVQEQIVNLMRAVALASGRRSSRRRQP